MKKNKIIEEFEILSEKLGYKVIHGRGTFSGDSCIVEENKYIVLNKNKPIEQKIKRFSQVFSKIDLSNVFLKPAIRVLVNQEKLEL